MQIQLERNLQNLCKVLKGKINIKCIMQVYGQHLKLLNKYKLDQNLIKMLIYLINKNQNVNYLMNLIKRKCKILLMIHYRQEILE